MTVITHMDMAFSSRYCDDCDNTHGHGFQFKVG